MTWIYTYKNKEYTLEELLQKYGRLYDIWKNSINTEYKFWIKTEDYISLFDIIVETTDEFEDRCLEEGYEIIYKSTLDKELDLNILLKPLIKV